MRQELDARTVGNDLVRLFWEPETDACTLVIERAGAADVEVAVAAADASDALRHPYLYAPPADEPTRGPRRRQRA